MLGISLIALKDFFFLEKNRKKEVVKESYIATRRVCVRRVRQRIWFSKRHRLKIYRRG